MGGGLNIKRAVVDVWAVIVTRRIMTWRVRVQGGRQVGAVIDGARATAKRLVWITFVVC